MNIEIGVCLSRRKLKIVILSGVVSFTIKQQSKGSLHPVAQRHENSKYKLVPQSQHDERATKQIGE